MKAQKLKQEIRAGFPEMEWALLSAEGLMLPMQHQNTKYKSKHKRPIKKPKNQKS